MSDAVITVENLGKRYRIQHQQQRQRYVALRDVLADKAGSMLRTPRSLLARLWSALRSPSSPLPSSPLPAPRSPLPAPGSPLPAPRSEDFWALRDVSFEVRQGESVGIIGRNGAGKTTLLKILSRITEPTTGRVTLRGRVASLLEVGTGFHPELTGRENIYLNGAILGMQKTEIERKFDEIVAFAEVEKFLDTPVKRYSSGMYVRLAFAVAAHLEPEILIVDEVLAVGDAQFQKKCLGKMDEVARGGRTVLFVSHNMQAVRQLCTTAYLFDAGLLKQAGPVQGIIEQYSSSSKAVDSAREWPVSEAPGDDLIRLLSFRVVNEAGVGISEVQTDEPFYIEMGFQLSGGHPELTIGFDIVRSDGTVVFRSFHNDGSEDAWPVLKTGRNCLRCEIPGGLLNAGSYQAAPRISLHCIRWIVDMDPVIAFHCQLGHGRSRFWMAYQSQGRPGNIAPIMNWKAHLPQHGEPHLPRLAHFPP